MRPLRHSRITWLNTIQQDLKSKNLSIPPGSKSSTLENVCFWCCTLLVVYASKEEEDYAEFLSAVVLPVLSISAVLIFIFW